MLKKRLIAVILVRDGQVVQSVQFKHTNVIHYDPIHAIESFNRWAVDEIVLLNVSKNPDSRESFKEVLQKISVECFVPISAGGWIEKIEQAGDLFARGADKIVVNTAAFRQPELISELARKYGNQAVVVSIDAKKDENQIERVAIDRGGMMTDSSVVDWAKLAEAKGAGEIFINSISHDGARKGYNLDLIRQVHAAVKIPVIAMGGVLTWDHLADGAKIVDAVAAANIFHYTEHSTKKAKKFLLDKGYRFRMLS